MIPRNRTPLRTAVPSLEASNQSQIDDLVQRNRTLGYTLKKQAEEHVTELQKAKDNILNMQQRWQAERIEWQQECEILQSCHRIVQLQNVLDTEKERMNILQEMDNLRIEKLKRLQRDFRITTFQARETELEERIAELEEERELLVVEYEETIHQFEAKHAQIAAQVQQNEHQCAVGDQERKELKVQLASLQEKNTQLQNSLDSLNSKLERTILKLEGAQTKCTELEKSNSDYSLANTDLRRQVERWQELETKGGTETEAQKKRCLELETELKDLSKKFDTIQEEKENEIAKEKRRVVKLKEALEEWKAEAGERERESHKATKELAKVQKELIKVKGELDIERARVIPPSHKANLERQQAEIEDLTEKLAKAQKEVDKLVADLEAERSLSKNPEPPPLEKDVEKEVSTSAEKPRAKAKVGKQSVKSREVAVELEESWSDKDNADQPKRKRKAKANADSQGGSEIQAVEDSSRRGKGAEDKVRKNFSDAELIGNPGPAVAGKKRGARASEDESETRQWKSKSKTREASISRPEQEASTEETTAPLKKKRRINVFPPPNNSSAFDILPPLENGLGIPTTLSPVKESQGVPSRSTSGSVLGSIGSALRSSLLPGRR